MSFFVNKKNIISALFLFCFIFYSVSPLSSRCIDNQADESTTKTAESHIKNLRLFLLELFASGISQGPEQSENPLSITILLKKRRAIVRAQGLLKGAPAQDYTVTSVTSSYTVLSELPGLQSIAHYDGPKSFDGFHYLYSGLSPPSV